MIATKAGFAVRDGKRVVDTSRRALLRDLAGSLERLGTDYVDLWQIHAWGEAPIEETLSALDHAVRQGMTRYVGVSNFVGWQTAQAATWQKAVPGRAPLTSLQVEYSLLARRAEIELLPAAAAFGLGLLPLVAAGPRGADRAVPLPHPEGLPGGLRPLRLVRPAVPGAAQQGRRRGGGPGRGRARPDPAAGGPAVGAGRARGDRSPARRPDGRPARAGAGHRGP